MFVDDIKVVKMAVTAFHRYLINRMTDFVHFVSLFSHTTDAMRAKLNYMLAVFLKEETEWVKEKCLSGSVCETKKNAFVAISIQTDLCCRLSSAPSFEFVFLCFIACTQKLSRVILVAKTTKNFCILLTRLEILLE